MASNPLPPFCAKKLDLIAALKAIVVAVEAGEAAKGTKLWAAMTEIGKRSIERRTIPSENAFRKDLKEALKSSTYEPTTKADKDRLDDDWNFAFSRDRELPPLEAKAIAEKIGASPALIRKAARMMRIYSERQSKRRSNRRLPA